MVDKEENKTEETKSILSKYALSELKEKPRNSRISKSNINMEMLREISEYLNNGNVPAVEVSKNNLETFKEQLGYGGKISQMVRRIDLISKEEGLRIKPRLHFDGSMTLEPYNK